MSKSVGDLPEEMIREVLLRLPVKSLLICKSVCKPWLHTISDPNFIKSNLHHQHTANPTLLEIQDPSQNDDLDIYDIFDIDEELLLQLEQEEQLRLQHLFEALLDVNVQDLSTSPIRIQRIVYELDAVAGSCINGILCVADKFGNRYLWNPSIRRCKKLPSSNWNPDCVLMLQFGFGYDSISDDYKVIRLTYNCKSISDGFVPVLDVYSSNADSWTEFHLPVVKRPVVEGELPHFKGNIVINGVLYFTVGDNLLSFDLRKQVFVLVPLPIPFLKIKSYILDFKGSVAIFFESPSGVDLWTLDDIFGEVSWTRKFSIEHDSNLDMWISSYMGAGQFYGKKSIRRMYLYNFLYDSEKKETKYYRFGEKDIYITLNYTETLVSLNGFEPVESFDGLVQSRG